MAVLRPDQAQLTFAVEAAPGGDAETGDVSDVSGGGTSAISVSVSPGSRTITCTLGSTFIVGDFIRIGDNADNTIHSNREIRRIEKISGTTFTLDRPLAFYHAAHANSEVIECTGYGSVTEGDAIITWVPGVYETVDTPDPVMAIEPRYFLGTQSKRDFFMAYKGQQTFAGSLSGITLLNGWPLRFPFGKIITVGGTDVGSSTYLSLAAKKGDMYITVNSASTLGINDYIRINDMGVYRATENVEMRRIISKAGNILRLNAPLEYDHIAASTYLIQEVSTAGFFYHHIVETIDLSSMSWHVRVADSNETDANAFIRRYVGGKVGSASISAEEGGLLTMNWDNVVFMDMLHNQQLHTITGSSHGESSGMSIYGSGQNAQNGGDVNMPGYAIMHDITAEHIGNALAPTDATSGGSVKAGFPTDEPYYFSQGTVTLWGQEFARIRSFQLSVNNNEDPRYYITGQHGRHRGPSEIREQRREYGMACILALPDSAASTTGGLDTATALFRELLLEGTYDTTTMKGFKVELAFDKANGDAIRIFLPGDDPTQKNTASGGAVLSTNLNGPVPVLAGTGNRQGCFIRRAEHAITTESPMQVEADILFKNIHIVIKDKNPLYP